MKSNFTKTLLMGSAIAMGAFGLTACGDDPVKPATAGGDAEIILDEAPSTVTAGATVKFLANIKLDVDNASADADLAIDSLKMEIQTAAGKKVNTIPSYTEPVLPNDKLSLSTMNVTVNLRDAGFGNQCGDFNLVIKVFAHLDGKKKTANQLIPFTRDTDPFCSETPASSAGGNTSTEIEMVAYTVEMSTDKLPGLNLATGTPSADLTSDIILTKTSGGVILSSGNGTLFAPIANEEKTPSNYDDDYDVFTWPEVENGRNAYVSDFLYKDINKAKINIVEAGGAATEIFVAKTAAFNAATGDGFFAFGAVAASEALNKDFNVTLKVYKKK